MKYCFQDFFYKRKYKDKEKRLSNPFCLNAKCKRKVSIG